MSSTTSAAAADIAEIDPESVLFHEYTHHFTFQYFPAAYPVWYSEGFAEFWGSTASSPDDVVEVGAPANHRFSTFQAISAGCRWTVCCRAQLQRGAAEPTSSCSMPRAGCSSAIMFDHPDRQRQINEYLRLINNGTAFAEAARRAIPDLAAFNSRAVRLLPAGGRFNVVRLPFRTIDVGPITVRTLRPAEQALIDEEIKLSQGYAQREATDFANHVRDVACAFPDDPFAIRMVMETQYLAGNNAEALAAADRLLADRAPQCARARRPRA